MAKALRTWEDAVSRASRQFNRTAPIDSVTWAREKEHVLALIKRSKDLKKAIPETIAQSILQAASMGLSLNPALQQCYLIPRKTKRGDPNAPIICYPSPSYRGLSKICMDSGLIVQIRAEVVFDADKFKYRGPIDKPIHEPILTDTHRQQKLCIGAYAIAEYTNGSYSCEYVDRKSIEAIRSMSDNSDGPMYTTLWTEGYKKIAIRRLCKTIGNGISGSAAQRLSAATDILNQHEGISIPSDDDYIEGEAVEIKDEPAEKISADHAIVIRDLAQEAGLAIATLHDAYGIEEIEQLPQHLYDPVIARISAYKEAKDRREKSAKSA